MVASKSAKTIKLSYPERVLGAFTQIQKEHKRHAVHIATLRAQVKKTAQAKKDKLGPHWSSFVGKAVHKLEDQGILAASNPTGSLTLTANGKKAIVAARRALAIPAHAALSSEQEELVWKQVTQQGPSRGVKRARRSSFLPRDDESEWGEDLSQVVPSKPKRARVSTQHVSPAKKPVAAMSKAELKSELAALQRNHEIALLRAGSPLTDLDEDDDDDGTNLLKDALKRKEAEIMRICRELDAARALNEAREKTPARFPTPETTFGYNTSSPTIPGSVLPTHSRPLQGVTRPQSGSFISNMSQQPTPTPSTPGGGPDDHELPDFENDVQNVPNHSNSLATPDHSPATSRADLPMIEEVGTSEKVADLERQLGSRKWDLERLQEKYEQLQDDYLTIEESLVDRDTRISMLQADVVTFEKQTSEDASTILRQASDLSEIQGEKDKMEVSFSSRVEELEKTIQAREKDILVLTTEKEKYLTQLSRAQEALSRAELCVADQSSQVATAQIQAATLGSTLEAAEADLEAQRTSYTQTLVEKESLQAELQTQRLLTAGLEEQRKIFLSQMSILEGNVDDLKATNDVMSEELSSVTSKNLSMSGKLQALESSHETLLAQLSVAKGEKSALAAALEVSDASVVSLTSQAASLNDALLQESTRVAEHSASLSHAQADMTALQEKITMMERSVSGLEADLSTSNASIDELRAQLTAAAEDRGALTLQLEQAQKTAVDSAASLAEMRSTLATATDNLRATKEAAAEVQVTLDTTTTKLQGEQNKNEELAESLATKESELREAARNLAMVESMAGKFREEAEANGAMAKDLSSQLLEVREKAAATTDLLSAAEASRAQESEKHKVAISAFEELLQSTQTEVDDLKSQVQAARAAHEGLESTFNDQRASLTLARDQLETERARVLDLESEAAAAVGKVQEVEEELAELKISKEADEGTIQNLKEMFTSLRETQMRSLAELDNQVISAQSTPVPKRRSTRAATSKLAPPFKLVK